MMKVATCCLVLVFVVSSFAQSVPAKPWPNAWNATVFITMSDIVIGAPAQTFYDNSRQMQATFFSQCAIAGGTVNNEPCIQVQSSVSSNFGVSILFNDLLPVSLTYNYRFGQLSVIHVV